LLTVVHDVGPCASAGKGAAQMAMNVTNLAAIRRFSTDTSEQWLSYVMGRRSNLPSLRIRQSPGAAAMSTTHAIHASTGMAGF
jgi:hypothetical protein